MELHRNREVPGSNPGGAGNNAIAQRIEHLTFRHYLSSPALFCFRVLQGGDTWPGESSTKSAFDEPMSKRRRGFPSETSVKRGRRIVHGEKELIEKLGRQDLCPCGSGRRFQTLLSQERPLRRLRARLLLLGAEPSTRPAEEKAIFPLALPKRKRRTENYQGGGHGQRLR
jgi:hypothetical protein